MDEDRSQEEAALSHSDGGPLRRVRDPGGLESESLTLAIGSILRSRSPRMSQISDSQASIESSAVTAQDQAVLSQSESESAITHAVSAAAADSSLASLPGAEMQPNVPASVSSVVTASLAMPTESSVTGSLASSLAPVGVLSSFTPVGVTSMLSVRESRSAAELERMHTGLSALSYAAKFVERADASFVQKEKTSCGGAMRSDVELTVHGGDASSDSSDETIELSPQVTVRGSVAGHTGLPAIATSSYSDLSLAASGPSMSVTSRWVEQQRERSPPVRRRSPPYYRRRCVGLLLIFF